MGIVGKPVPLHKEHLKAHTSSPPKFTNRAFVNRIFFFLSAKYQLRIYIPDAIILSDQDTETTIGSRLGV